MSVGVSFIFYFMIFGLVGCGWENGLIRWMDGGGCDVGENLECFANINHTSMFFSAFQPV